MPIQNLHELSKTQNQRNPRRKLELYLLSLFDKIRKVKSGGEFYVSVNNRNQKILRLLKNL